jgi:hypothetical protein
MGIITIWFSHRLLTSTYTFAWLETPPLSLIRFLVGHNPMAFNSICSSEHDEAESLKDIPFI